MGLYRKVATGSDPFYQHSQLLQREIDKLHKRISLMEDGRAVRPTRWIYVGSVNDGYLAGTPWEKYLTADSPVWENSAYPLDPLNSPVRFRLIIDREITYDIEGGFHGTKDLSMWTMPDGLWRPDVPYVKFPVAAGNYGTITLKITDVGQVIPLA